MNIIETENILCPLCMKQHEVQTILVADNNIFKGVAVEYNIHCQYCPDTDEYYETEEQLVTNDIAMKNAYRIKTGLLTSDEIIAIREKYGMTQTDLSLLLGWGAKTITRYEGHQVQDTAHDTILKKLDADPEWFLALLEKIKDKLGDENYNKTFLKASQLFENAQDSYLRKAIHAKYMRYENQNELTGNTSLNIDKVVDTIRYFSASEKMHTLYKVKLMKLLWYSDAISYKRRGHSITGLVYRAQTMGALPIAHDTLIELNGIRYKEIEFEDSTGYHFLPDDKPDYPSLSSEDMQVLDTVIEYFGSCTKDEIVEHMHNEKAYQHTKTYDLISFRYAVNLSVN